MIEGVVNAARQAVVTLSLSGPEGQSLEIDVVVDTGFSGFLTLPTFVVEELGLALAADDWALLADGSVVDLRAYYVTVTWDGVARNVRAYAVENVPLLGMSMLDDHDLSVRVRVGGRVLIEAVTE